MASPADFQAYFTWVSEEGRKNPGTAIVGGKPVERHFLPYQTLKDYWDDARVRLFLGDSNIPESTITSNRYLRIFATLIFTARAQRGVGIYVEQFRRKSLDDDHLPFTRESLSDIFTNPRDGKRDGDNFYTHQFRFCPRQLFVTSPTGERRMKLDHTDLQASDVLPMTHIENLNQPLDPAAGISTLALFELMPSSGLQTPSVSVLL